MDPQGKVVVVTGTSSGMGEAIAQHLAKAGSRVFGGDLVPEPTNLAGFTRTRLDICDDSEVRGFIEQVHGEAGRIDILINNAGVALGGAIEEASLDEARALFEVNFFGAARLVKAALPILRAQGTGRIINISSGAAQVAEPYAGFYSASKFAVEGYTEALRMEVREFGIDVSLVVPGWTHTGIFKHGRRPAARIADYVSTRSRVDEAVEGYIEQAPPPAHVAEVVLKVVRSRRPRLRYRAGSDVNSSFWAKRFTPAALYERLIRGYYQLNAAPTRRQLPAAGPDIK